MGLKEKKAARDFQENNLEDLKKKVFDAAKFEFEIEIDWDSLSVDNYAHLYSQTWTQIYFEPMIIAFSKMCADSFSQEAIQDDLKKVVIQNIGDISNANKYSSYSNGVLTLNHSSIANAENQIEDRAKALQDTVENAL
ncbi:hypothetical protein H5154_19870 [Pseudoalteromonas sp. SR44-5]|uniref:Uncharacterized protein n=1 Tax=Pseudoalteromonas rhizosphaerae TaxID=2518973 RepID=A0ABW8L3F6_9GAMM|nr:MULTISPECIES: hypothetical protein [unclassified Pseudoalteromonas]MBB1335291.1 hypothetical protein [Pseudoalteromonas sp. SR41-6]MBB1344176.1 hypothetical protein [Pseudoalteromonas sp. SR45-6]MBB1368602.1 hypothetical protein [Pseudoalteromonas sp. SR44-5]MBB1419890.1 hypothetical protein [Pseudoalteromonas sp. SG44-1]MBB1435634.1 hypothetical protein [Pseudoalteromonas sp. SG43-6]